MNIELWPIDRPIPYANNARKLSGAAVDKVALSIREFGWRQPVVVDAAGVIIAGHTRLFAAKKLGLEKVPVHIATELTPAQVKAYRLMDNRSHQETEWDLELLSSELFDLKSLEMDLALTGFDDLELAELLAERTVGLTDEDEVPETPAEPVTTPGDVWILGKHRLLCGDCRDSATVDRLFETNQANLVFTSPPYAEQRDYDKSSAFRPIPPGEYVAWYHDVAANIQAHLASDGSYFLNIKPSCEGLDTQLYVFDLVLTHARDWGFHFATEFCWERNGVPKSVTQRFKNQFEPVYQFALNRWKMHPEQVRHESPNVPIAGGRGSGETSWRDKQGGRGDWSVTGSFGGAKKRRNGTSKSISDCQGVTADAGEWKGPGLAFPGNRLPSFCSTHEATGHVAAFPVGLPDFFIRAFTDAQDIISDPFMGSGSTLIASEKTARNCYGLEISPAYCDVIIQRWQNFTGKQATLEGGRTFDEMKEERLAVTA